MKLLLIIITLGVVLALAYGGFLIHEYLRIGQGD